MLKTMLLSLCLATTALAGAPDEAPISVKFHVTTQAKAVLLAGDVALTASRPATIERKAPRGPERQTLTLDVRPLDDGRLLVRALWSDWTDDGESVKWEPSFVIKRASETQVHLDFPGGGRVLRLSAD